MWRSYPQAQEQEGGRDKMTSQSNNDNEEDNEAAKKKTEITTATASLTMHSEGKSKDPVYLKEEVEGIKQPPLSPRQNKDNTVDLTDLLSDTDDDDEEEDQDLPSQKDEKTQEEEQATMNHQAAAEDSESLRKKLSYPPSASRSKRVPIKASEAVRNKGFRHLKRDRWYTGYAKRHPMFRFGRPRGLSEFIERGKKKTNPRSPEEDIEVGNDGSSPSDPSSATMRSNNDTDLHDQKVTASANKPNDGEKAGTASKPPPVTARLTVHEVDTRTTSSVAAAQHPTTNSPKLTSLSLDVAAPTSATDKSSTAKAGGLDALVRSLSCPQSVLAKVLTSSSPRRTECVSRDSRVSKSREEGTTESSNYYSSGWSTEELKRCLERSRKYGFHNEKTKQMEEEIQSRENHQKSSLSSSPDTTSKVHKAASPTSMLDRSVVGSRVAKKFVDEETYFGTVTSFSSTRRLWFIVYDDGDREEMDADELFSALELFQKKDEGLDLSLKANMSLGDREKNLPSEQDVETPKEDLFSSIPDEAFGSLDSFVPQKRMNNTQDLAGMEEDASTLSGKTGNAVMEDEKLSVESSRRRKKFSFLGSSRFLKRKAGALYSTAASSLRKASESVPGKHSDSNDSDAYKTMPSTDVELPEKTQEDVYESHPDEDNVVGNSNTNEKPSDIAVETVSPPPAKKTKTTTTTTMNLEVHPLAQVTQESPSLTSTGNEESNEDTPTVDGTVATNDVVNVTQNTNSDSESIVLHDNEQNSITDCNENEDNDIDSIKPEEYEGQVVDNVEVLRQEEEEEEEFDLISTEDHALEPYAENELTVVEELGEEEFEDGLADISIGTLVTAGAPLVVLVCIFWGIGMVELSSSLLEALSRAPFQLALLGIGSQSRFAVAGYILFMFYLAAQEISARTMYTFDGQFYVALGSLVLSVVTVTVFAVAVRIKPSRMWNAQYALPLISLLLTNSIASVALSMDSVCGSIASDEFLMGTNTGSIDILLSTTLWASAIHKGAGPTMSMLQKVGTMNVPVMMAGLILGGGGGGGETKATVPVAAKCCLLILFLSALCTFSSIFMTIAASIKMVTVDGDGCTLRG